MKDLIEITQYAEIARIHAGKPCLIFTYRNGNIFRQGRAPKNLSDIKNIIHIAGLINN